MKIILDVMTCFLLGRPKQCAEPYWPYILFSEHRSYIHRYGNIESNKTQEGSLSIKHFLHLAITIRTFLDVPFLNFPRGVKKFYFKVQNRTDGLLNARLTCKVSKS
jgi:hypothetical protein